MSQGGSQSAIDFLFINQPMCDNFLDMAVDERKDIFDLSYHCFLITKGNFSNMNVQYTKVSHVFRVLEDK